jgi:phenol hydroxylase P1 protein
MNIDIQAEAITPKRQTFSHVARRLGGDKLASRYEEATFDVQPVVNFHYRPTWDPGRQIFDPARTAIVMEDWYVFKDPRQYYYATYNIKRAAMQAGFDTGLDFVEKRGLFQKLDDDQRSDIGFYLVPLRHFEWAANMNFQLIADWGYGTQITSAAAFCGTDRLALAQLISGIGLALDGGGDTILVDSKQAWIEAAEWQPFRRMVENLLCVRDWFESFTAQTVIDGLVYPLVYREFDRQGPEALSLVTDFMTEWFADISRWTDAVIKAAAGESEANREKLSAWANDASTTAIAALRPIAVRVLDQGADAALASVEGQLWERLTRLGLVRQEQVA